MTDKPETPELAQLLTLEQVATHLQVSRKTVERYIKKGALTAIKYGTRTVRVDPDELEKFREKYKTK